ncbi:hypothetical protein [Streptomyces radicis]|uniref:Flp family type IVb pilin n=1 Tax=Streptomyces radicis TaxID=1750517 RepID=A0A3A9WDY8_9ACTN|nr:hypothetical protein [Streptomyces radicis]RKN07634.1 hypothetical protein D7319_18425 [Streptomyces radicis]RKN18357.1 hypothetical protein D7318_22660 [Streptomyces radicis]
MSRLLSTWGQTIRDRLSGRYSDRGAGFVEYAGLLLLIAAVVVAVLALPLETTIANAIRDAVGRVVNAE